MDDRAGAAAPEVATGLDQITWGTHTVHRASIVDGPFLLDLTIAQNDDGSCNLAINELAGGRGHASVLLKVDRPLEEVKRSCLLLARKWAGDEIEIISDRVGLEHLFSNPPPAPALRVQP
jgi:hypothetical protein